VVVQVVVAHAAHGHAGGGHGRVRGVEERVRHEGEDGVEGNSADESEAVDVAEVDFAAKEEEEAEEEEEEDGAEEVGVVHDVLVDAGEGVEDGKGLKGILSNYPPYFVNPDFAIAGDGVTGQEVCVGLPFLRK